MGDEPAKRKISTANVNSKASQNSSVSKDLSESNDSSRLNKFDFCVGDHCETVSVVTVRADEALESEVTNELPDGTTLDIIEVWPSRPEIPLRAKIQAGSIRGWISVRTHLNEPMIAKKPQDLAEAIPNFEVGGHHEVISLSTMRVGESLDSEVMTDLKPGTIVKIIEVGQTNRRCAKVEADVVEGWISVTTHLNEPLISKAEAEVKCLLTLRVGESLDSECITELKLGAIVKIIELGQTSRRRAKVEAEDAEGWISLATRQGESLVRFVKSEMKSETKSETKILLESARFGDLEAMKKIVEGKPGCPNLNCSDNRGKTALIYAVSFGNKDIVDYLLTKRHEVDVNGMDDTQKTALHHAARRTRSVDQTKAGITWALLTAGAMIEARDHNGLTPLMFSVEANGDEAVAKVLLENGACVNAKDNEGRRCLSYAKHFGYDELAALLREHGAVDSEDEDGDESGEDGCMQKGGQANILYETKISRLSSEQIQVCCTNMAGELLDTWYFGSDAILMKLKAEILNNKLVETKCRTIGMKHPCVIFLLNDGTLVRPASRIAEYECLSLLIQGRLAAGETYAGEDSEDGGEDGEESENGGEDGEESENGFEVGEESEDGGEDSEESLEWQDDVCEAEFTPPIRSPSSGI